MMYRRVAVLLILAACSSRQQQPPSSVRPLAGAGDWSFYNGSLSGERYSTLNQITAGNVARLEQTCAFETQDTVSFQSGIVAVGGTLYFTAFNTTYAIDGATCRQKWKFTLPEPKTLLNVNRGVAYSGGVVFRGTADGHVL